MLMRAIGRAHNHFLSFFEDISFEPLAKSMLGVLLALSGQPLKDLKSIKFFTWYRDTEKGQKDLVSQAELDAKP